MDKRLNQQPSPAASPALGLRLVVGFETPSETDEPKRELVAFDEDACPPTTHLRSRCPRTLRIVVEPVPDEVAGPPVVGNQLLVLQAPDDDPRRDVDRFSERLDLSGGRDFR